MLIENDFILDKHHFKVYICPLINNESRRNIIIRYLGSYAMSARVANKKKRVLLPQKLIYY